MTWVIKKITFQSADRSKGAPNNGRSKIFVWPADETIFENISGRHNRPHNIWKKVLRSNWDKISQLFKEKHSVYGWPDLHNLKLSWRQKCGCSCPCSPGFLVERRETTYTGEKENVPVYGEVLHITIDWEE